MEEAITRSTESRMSNLDEVWSDTLENKLRDKEKEEKVLAQYGQHDRWTSERRSLIWDSVRVILFTSVVALHLVV